MDEIEAKFKVDGHETIRDRLKQADAAFVGRYVEKNHILDSVDGLLRRSQCGLRVRIMQTVEGEPVPTMVTYKGPPKPGPFKQREEIETAVGDSRRMLPLLEALGFKTVMEYCKRRERWVLGTCHVELDEVPMLGWFVEIEGPHEQAVAAARRALGLDALEIEKRTYVGMLADCCAELGRTPMGIDFND